LRYQYTSSGFKSSFTPPQFFIPQGIKTIIIINVIIFAILEISGLKSDIFRQFGLIPSKTLFEATIWQPFTYMFLHDGFLHILLNMLFLWMFGKDVEIAWGKIAFYKYYMVTGVGSGLLNAIIHYHSTIPVVGASGAVFGVLLAFAVLYPNRIVLLYGLVPIRVKYLVIGLAFIALFSSILLKDSRVSHLTHLSGMITGFIYLNWNWLKWKLKTLVQPKKEEKPTKSFSVNEKQQRKVYNTLIQRRVDEILDKLSEEGWDKLTDAEQKILYRASEEYSRRDQPN
jgi:membrane associated rhomboid family serine protease